MRKILLLTIIIILVTGCYHVDIQQGNIIDKDTMAQLHLGLNKNEVDAILGVPLLDNSFNKNIWTYIYTHQTNGGKIEKKKLTLEFKENKLIRIAE